MLNPYRGLWKALAIGFGVVYTIGFLSGLVVAWLSGII